MAVDASGGPAIDPTPNVLDLVEAANKRQDDLREASCRWVATRCESLEKLSDLRAAHNREISDIRSSHSREMRRAEAERLNSIRQVDVTAVKTEADRALAAIQTLAATTATNAENLRNALNATATTIANQTASTVSALSERIAALEKSSYEGKGKQFYSDPILEQLTATMNSLKQSRDTVEGRTGGVNAVWVAIAGVVAAFGILVTIVVSLFAFRTTTPASVAVQPPQVIYAPAPSYAPGPSASAMPGSSNNPANVIIKNPKDDPAKVQQVE